MTPEESVLKAKAVLVSADALLITAGAGIGVDSGLPDFRGNEGFWKAYPPIAKLGISFVEMANPYWFEKDPRLAWAFYGHRLNLYRKTHPHDGFRVLLDYASSRSAGYFVFTSNVDGQFQKAGFNEENMCECHGTIHFLQCSRPCMANLWSSKTFSPEIDSESFRVNGDVPECPECHAIARPNILMFGDWSWISDRTEEQREKLESWLSSISRNNRSLVIIEIGAGTAVATIRMTSEGIAREMNATLIRINPRDYTTPQGHISLPFSAKNGIEKLFNQ